MKTQHPPAPSCVGFRQISATVIPFPCTRCLGHIRRTVRAMAAADPKWAEAHLRIQLQRLAERLERLGQPLNVVAREWLAFEHAVRRELQASRTPGDAA